MSVFLDKGKEFFYDLWLEVDFRSPERVRLYSTVIRKTERLEDSSYEKLAETLSAALTEAVLEVRTQIIERLGSDRAPSL